MKTKKITRLWSLMLLLMAMLVPSLALAQPGIIIDKANSVIMIRDNVTITTDTDWSTYNSLIIEATLTINEGVTLTVPEDAECSGTVNNYGTFEGEIMYNDGTINNYGGTISFIIWNGAAYVDVDMNTHVWSEWTTTEAASTTQFGTDVRTCPGDDSHAAHSETRIRYKLHDASIAPSAYNGTPTTPQRITADNYADYGFTASNYQLYENWYAITSAEELFGYTSVCDEDGNNAILLNDIVINADGDDTYTWTPKYLYYNTFDGAGHTIAGLKVDITNSFAGLFGALDHSALVKNLGIINSAMTTASYYAGGIAGKVFTGCTITNCYVMNVAVRTGASHVGGITGDNQGGTVSNCFAVATVNGGDADIIAPTSDGGTNTNCYGAATLAELDGAATGELCYKLNGETSDGSQAWYQAIGTDTYPVLTNTGSNTVYFGYADCTATEKSVYSNSADCEIQGHIDGHNGYCVRCGSELPTTDLFTLTDGVAYNRTTQCIANTLNYTRNYTGNWQALYVPFALDVDALKADYDIAYIIGVRQEDTDNDGTIDYQCMDVGYMPSASKTKANYPYLIRKKTAEDDATITLTDVTIEPAASKSVVCSTILNNYTVTGAYTETAAEAMNGKYGMDSDGSLCLCDGTSALKPQRWAMAVESRGDTPYTIVGGAGAKSIMIHVIGEDDDTATGISSVEYDQSSTSNCYNIAGQRVKSNARGLVIKNGKKYLNK